MQQPTGVTEEQLKLLRAFSPNYHWKVQTANQYGTICVCFMDARDVQDILDDVVGPANWAVSYPARPGGQTICALSIFVNGQWVTKEDTGSESDIEAEKGKISDSFKRAAVAWGIGRFMYRIPVVKTKSTTNAKGKYVAADASGRQIYDLTKYIRQERLDPGMNQPRQQEPKPEPQRPPAQPPAQEPTAAPQPEANPAQPAEQPQWEPAAQVDANNAQRMAASHAILKLYYLMKPHNIAKLINLDQGFWESNLNEYTGLTNFLGAAPIGDLKAYFNSLKDIRKEFQHLWQNPERPHCLDRRAELIAHDKEFLASIGFSYGPLAGQHAVSTAAGPAAEQAQPTEPEAQAPSAEPTPAAKPKKERKPAAKKEAAPASAPAPLAETEEPVSIVDELINTALEIEGIQQDVIAAFESGGSGEETMAEIHQKVYRVCIELMRHKIDDVTASIANNSRDLLKVKLQRTGQVFAFEQYQAFLVGILTDVEKVIKALKAAMEDDGPPPF